MPLVNKPIKCSKQGFRTNVKKVVGLIETGERICTSTMLNDKVLEEVFFWVLFGGEEEGMLKKVSQTLHRLWIGH